MRRALLSLVAALAAAGCIHTGPAAERYPPALGPHGLVATLVVRGSGALSGELLEVRPAELVMLSAGSVVIVPFADVRRADFPHADAEYWGGVPTPTALATLRLLSRFPQGMPSVALAQLLRSTGQSAPRAPAP